MILYTFSEVADVIFIACIVVIGWILFLLYFPSDDK